jgi:hypothetical protein
MDPNRLIRRNTLARMWPSVRLRVKINLARALRAIGKVNAGWALISAAAAVGEDDPIDPRGKTQTRPASLAAAATRSWSKSPGWRVEAPGNVEGQQE